MHELPVTEKILSIVLKHAAKNHVSRVISITLRVGELSDLEDQWLTHYFSYLAKGTVAQDAVLKIEKVPIVFECNKCKTKFRVNKKDLGETACPQCGAQKNFSLLSGREYFIKEMEAI